jgi:hypothetical protein
LFFNLEYCNTFKMKKATPITQGGKRAGAGRPATGKDPMLSSRMPAALIGEIEAWADAQGVTRSAALRRLVELGLKAKGK